MSRPGDCPHCRSSGTVERGECQVCFEPVAPRDDRSPVDAEHGVSLSALRFADVIAELDAVAGLAATGKRSDAAQATRRARVMLEHLRGQFLAEVILSPPDVPPVPEAAAAEPASS